MHAFWIPVLPALGNIQVQWRLITNVCHYLWKAENEVYIYNFPQWRPWILKTWQCPQNQPWSFGGRRHYGRLYWAVVPFICYNNRDYQGLNIIKSQWAIKTDVIGDSKILVFLLNGEAKPKDPLLFQTLSSPSYWSSSPDLIVGLVISQIHIQAENE